MRCVIVLGFLVCTVFFLRVIVIAYLHAQVNVLLDLLRLTFWTLFLCFLYFYLFTSSLFPQKRYPNLGSLSKGDADLTVHMRTGRSHESVPGYIRSAGINVDSVEGEVWSWSGLRVTHAVYRVRLRRQFHLAVESSWKVSIDRRRRRTLLGTTIKFSWASRVCSAR